MATGAKSKSSYVSSLNISGSFLFLLLVGILSLATLILDGAMGQVLELGRSLTLPLLICTLVTALLGYRAVPLLRSLKMKQFIREDGPQAHLKKHGTRQMGGVFFVPVALAIALWWSWHYQMLDFPSVLAVSLLTLGYAAIGWLDDWQILRTHSNRGISPRMKLGLQISLAALFCLWLALSQPVSIASITLPFGLTLPLGLLFWPLAGFVMVAESNATNLTDGVDGLAAGTGAIALLGLAALVASTSPGLMMFCACMSGGYLGFLAHNRNPARVFMGDTGSLALGGALAGVALLTNNLWGLFIISGIFFAETISVMLQVGYYKATKGPDGIGKRLFKMAPLHHHLELSGWKETQVVGVFYAIAWFLVLLALLLH